jgi:hypothetical protein
MITENSSALVRTPCVVRDGASETQGPSTALALALRCANFAQDDSVIRAFENPKSRQNSGLSTTHTPILHLSTPYISRLFPRSFDDL